MQAAQHDDHDIYGHINNVSDLEHVYEAIRENVHHAEDRPHLTQLYKRAGYLLTLMERESWKDKFGKAINDMKKVGEKEFSDTAHDINLQAEKIGTDADYKETWGSGSSNDSHAS